MSDNIRHWAHKLDKIQYALDILTQVKAGRDVDRLIKHLQEQEDIAAKDLIEAEQAEEDLEVDL